jgi:hypothetical protein
VALDAYARVFADELRQHTRERPLHAQFAIESLDPARSFAVEIGGFYRMISRTPSTVPAQDAEGAVLQAISRTLQRVGITFSPQDYQVAARAMLETLREDPLLQAELLVIHTQLLRPTVHIQPDRSMLKASQAGLPDMPETHVDLPARHRHGLIRSELPGDAVSADDAPPWASLAAASGRAQPSVKRPDTPAPWTGAPEARDAGHTGENDRQPMVEREGLNRFIGASDQLATPASSRPLRRSGSERARWQPPGALRSGEDAKSSVPEPPAPPPDNDGTDSADGPEAVILQHDTPAAEVPTERVELLLSLLQKQGPAWFKMCALELQDQPENLPAIVAGLTDDVAVHAEAADVHVQRALVVALQAFARGGMPGRRPVAEPPVSADSDAGSDDLPDWLRLRQRWNGDGGGT